MQSSKRQTTQSDFQKIDLEDLRSLNEEPSEVHQTYHVIREFIKAFEWFPKGSIENRAFASAEH